MKLKYSWALLLMLAYTSGWAQKKNTAVTKPTEPAKKEVKDKRAEALGGLQWRSIGPAVTSGRISDLAINPHNFSEYYVAAASGGVWKTTNHGVTFSPVFDGQGSYSIGCITLDPNNPATVWVGSGENNNQRSVAYGDGIYKSTDGGKSWKNMGLKNSEHIGMIRVVPGQPNTVYVAAYGPVWSAGGDRGIYKTTDGGKTWNRIHHVSDDTGFNEIHLDPRDPNTLYACAHQRRRSVFSYIGGGPESALYKSTDGGATWNKCNNGLPKGDVGRIGLAISPVNPDMVYAIVEASDKGGGIYRSTDRGESWSKMSGYSTSGNYYQEIFCDPKDVDKIYVTDVFFKTSDDGGKTMKNLGEKHKHVDNHALWINPNDTKHLLVGCDGGLYESYDGGDTWNFKANLPITQFYKVTTDNSYPFYYVYGGTQDNFSLGGPSRSISANGIPNSDWFITQGGDGFESAVDPEDPNIVYAQAQYGYLTRYDRKSGENVDIRPVENPGEPAYRWNWDAPLSVSQHRSSRLYFAANKVFKSEDRGNSWTVISPDLSRQLDRNKLEIMGKVWSMDAIAKNGSTDIYGQITSLAESKLDEQLLYAGTDDGLVHVTTDGGKNWRKIDNIPGCPKQSYVGQIIASQHDKNVVYVCFNHHRYGDFKPYVFKSSDMGMTWKAIHGNLPERGSVYTLGEDHVDTQLLFAGTEFGVFVSFQGGDQWTALKNGLPTIAVRDLDIQRRENDLVIATFGRGFYVLDDYTPLRGLKESDLDKAAFIFPVKESLMYHQSLPLGIRGKGFLGESHYAAKNPSPGAVFTYFVKEEIKTLKQKRKDAEKEADKNKTAISYPTFDAMRAEDRQPEPYFLFVITDAQGKVVRRMKTGTGTGIQRISWNFRYDHTYPTSAPEGAPDNPFAGETLGRMAAPGMYAVQLFKYEDGVVSSLTEPVKFSIKALNNATTATDNYAAKLAFSEKVAGAIQQLSLVNEYFESLKGKLDPVKKALLMTPSLPLTLQKEVYDVEQQLHNISVALYGDQSLARREFETLPDINTRIGTVEGTIWSNSSPPTQTAVRSLEVALEALNGVKTQLRQADATISNVEKQLNAAGAPYTPGRKPE